MGRYFIYKFTEGSLGAPLPHFNRAIHRNAYQFFIEHHERLNPKWMCFRHCTYLALSETYDAHFDISQLAFVKLFGQAGSSFSSLFLPSLFSSGQQSARRIRNQESWDPTLWWSCLQTQSKLLNPVLKGLPQHHGGPLVFACKWTRLSPTLWLYYHVILISAIVLPLLLLSPILRVPPSKKLALTHQDPRRRWASHCFHYRLYGVSYCLETDVYWKYLNK